MSKLISEVTPYAPNGTASDYGLRASAVQYGTCSTAMTTAAKVVTCTTFTADYLVEGSIIAVKFTAANPSNVNNEADPADFTLNVNNTGAKPIQYIYQGTLSNLPTKGFIKQDHIYLFYYDGTYWVAMIANDTDTVPVDIDVSGGTTELEWGETQTIVNINGTDIRLKMPDNPDTNTTYTVTTTGNGNAVTSVTLSGTTITASKDATYNNYTHPAHTSQELGLYKIEVDNLGHVASTTAASISDLPHDHDDTYLKLTGGTLTGALTLSSASATDSPALVFQRGTLSDNYNDWRLIDTGGYLHFQERGNGSSSWTDRVTMTTNGTVVATTFSGTSTYATKASQDGSGNDIESTYATKSELSGYATSTHAHGNITTSGYMTTSATISNGDRLVITDSSNSHKMVTSTISFDGSTATKALTQKGTWETFNNYTHPTYTSQEQKLYKVSVDTKGHVDSVATVSKADITALGIPGQDTNTTYTFTVSGNGSALSGITITGTTITFNKNYSHPTYTSQEQKLYKVSVDTSGHVDSVTTVSKADITGLGIPAQDTTYTFTKSGTGNALTGISVSGTTITFNSANYNNYSHPTYTSQESGLYKVTVDTTGHVSSTTTVSKADITGLGIPGENTTYTVTTTGTGNAVTAVGLSGTTITVTKGATYNNYSHPTYTSQESGLYKITVDGTGHVSSTTTASINDLSHSHGNITMSGTMTATVTIANGDRIVITDSSDSKKITSTSITFDGSTATKALTQKGTWESFTNNPGTVTSVSIAGGTGITVSGNAITSAGTVTINHTNSVTAKTAAAQSGKTLTFGGTFTLYEEKYDAQGHVTGVSSYTMTMPANPNTDTKVIQSDTTTASWRKVVVGYQSAASSGAAVSTQTNQVYVSNKLEYQPSSGTLRATQYLVNDAVTLSYNSTTKSLDFIFA